MGRAEGAHLENRSSLAIGSLPIPYVCRVRGPKNGRVGREREHCHSAISQIVAGVQMGGVRGETDCPLPIATHILTVSPDTTLAICLRSRVSVGIGNRSAENENKVVTTSNGGQGRARTGVSPRVPSKTSVLVWVSWVVPTTASTVTESNFILPINCDRKWVRVVKLLDGRYSLQQIEFSFFIA